VLAAAIVAGIPAGAAEETQLRAVRGTVGYQAAKDAPFARVFGSFLLQNDQFAVTRGGSNALLVLTDSSEVALGENTDIQVGQITQVSATEPTAITLVAGAMRFAIRHPAGGQSNYRFFTSTSQIAVRGTIGMLSTGPDGDVVSCLDCAPGDVTVSAGGNTFPLVTGQSAVVTTAGAVTIATTSTAIATSFAHTGLSTVANSSTPFSGGIHAGTAAGSGATAGVAAGAGIAAAAAAIQTSANSAATRSGAPVIAVPAPAPSPTGAITVNSHGTELPAAPGHGR
jgi:hypothetical protein